MAEFINHLQHHTRVTPTNVPTNDLKVQNARSKTAFTCMYQRLSTCQVPCPLTMGTLVEPALLLLLLLWQGGWALDIPLEGGSVT